MGVYIRDICEKAISTVSAVVMSSIKVKWAKCLRVPTVCSSSEVSSESELSMYWDIEMLEFMFERKDPQISIDVGVGTVLGWMCAIPENQEVTYADADTPSESEDNSESAGDWQ